MIEEVIKKFAPEVLAPKMFKETLASKRDKYKGQLLAYQDFATIDKVYEEKGFAKLKEYLDRIDPYAENLSLYVNLYEERAEAVVASKIETLFLLKDNVLKYINELPTEVPAGEDKVEEAPEAESVEDKV